MIKQSFAPLNYIIFLALFILKVSALKMAIVALNQNHRPIGKLLPICCHYYY